MTEPSCGDQQLAVMIQQAHDKVFNKEKATSRNPIKFKINKTLKTRTQRYFENDRFVSPFGSKK